MRRIFITGFPRSGTSLLLRLLGDTPDRKAFAQPLPLLLSEVRRRFLRSAGRDEVQQAYPFADDQYENFIPPQAFTAFLDDHPLSPGEVRDSLDAMSRFSGQRFQPRDRYASLEGWPGGPLGGFVDRYFQTHGSEVATSWVWKELSVEPLIGYLAQWGWQSLVIVRDPRDAIASMYFGEGQAHVGLPRPLLFLARQWRRSALYALAQPFGLAAVRYEALIADPKAVLGPVADGEPVLTEALNVRNNSSFGVRTGRVSLSDQDRRFVEALCFAEMEALGYAPSIEASQIDAILTEGPEKEVLHRPVLERFLWSQARLEEEIDRRARVQAAPSRFQCEAFLFVEAYQRLR